jgi:hypothetical protein
MAAKWRSVAVLNSVVAALARFSEVLVTSVSCRWTITT